MESKEKAKKLMAERDKLDAEIEDNLAILTENGCTMDSPLVDPEGYPFSHIDIWAVRKARHTIICLRNVRKELSEQIKDAIEETHAEYKLKMSKSSSSNEAIDEQASAECCKEVSNFNGTIKPTIVHRTSNEPFLKVTVVETNSPAAKGGLRAGDLIIQYGDLHAANFKELKEVALTTNKYEGKKLCVTTLRRGRAVRLEIYPQSWSGSGILGCGIIPISRANST